jgi:hypothetical protein
MNFLIFITFFIYVLSVLISGLWLHSFLTQSKEKNLHRALFVGEAFLLGSIIVVGELLILSILGLYKPFWMAAVVLLNYGFWFYRPARQAFVSLWQGHKVSFSFIVFVLLSVVFLFRNSYFLVDIDSHSCYLFAQKLWVEKGTSLFASKALDARVFVPHFDALPFGLGIALFGQNTLFAELINWLGRYSALLLVFGYVTYRFNAVYGLAAMMLVLFNDHFFYSGINQAVVINGFLIAFLFATALNFWEAYKEKNTFRLALALIFLSQLMANKYQMAYVVVMFLAVGIFLQKDIKGMFFELWKNRSYRWGMVIAFCSAGLWFLKNFLATGLPTFPVLAGKFYTLGWTPEMESTLRHILRGVTPSEFLKYTNYLFIWPGVTPAKFVSLGISFLPLIYFCAKRRGSVPEEKFFELCYWLGISFLVLMGSCLASHQDPRYYRYAIAIYTFATILLFDFIGGYCFLISRKVWIGALLFVFALTGIKVANQDFGGTMKRPTFEDNWKVLTNQIQMDYAIQRHYPQNIIAKRVINQNRDKILSMAWDTDGHHASSTFLLPLLPQVGWMFTSVVQWDSFKNEAAIVRDLEENNIRWILTGGEGVSMNILSPEEYADVAVTYERYPEKIAFPYTMPPELTRSKL